MTLDPLRAMRSYFTTEKEPPWTRWLLLAFLPLLFVYYFAASRNSELKNDDVYRNDQKVYLNTASKIWNDPWGYRTPRQRTPGYPYFLSLFYKGEFNAPEGSKPPFTEAWFERGKRINLNLSVLLLAGLFFTCRTQLSLIASGLVTVGSGMLLFTFKAGYVQPELTYWVLNLALFVLLGRMLVAPSWRLAVICGLLSALTYFVKAGTQPLLLLFAVTWGIKLIWDALRRRRECRDDEAEPGRGTREFAVAAGQGALVIVLFVVLLLPYFAATKKVFGKATYSVYTEYMLWLPLEESSYLVNRDYMWALYFAGARERPIDVDQFNESLLRAIGERIEADYKKRGEELSAERLDELIAADYRPLDELPSLRGYFAEHSASDGYARVTNALWAISKRIRKYYDRSASLVRTVFKLAGLLLLFRLLALWGRSRERFPIVDLGPNAFAALARWPYLAFYATGFFAGYLLLYAWYDALQIGPRLVLSLYLPLLFVGVFLIRHIGGGLAIRLPEKICSQPVYLRKVANVILLITIAYLSIRLLDGELYKYKNTGG